MARRNKKDTRKKYRTAIRITHDGRDYYPGEHLLMEPEDAHELILRGSLAEAGNEFLPSHSGLNSPLLGEFAPNPNAAKRLTEDAGTSIPEEDQDLDEDLEEDLGEDLESEEDSEDDNEDDDDEDEEEE